MISGVDPVSLDCFGLSRLQKVEPRLEVKKSSLKYIDYASDYGVGNRDYEMQKI